MAIEIERKFLVNSTEYRTLATASVRITQAYLSVRPESTVRVRIKDDSAYITVKGKSHGASRKEWEYRIDVNDAQEMIDECSCSTVIDKTRYYVGDWEIDEFHGTYEGLVVAEIELDNETQDITLPGFIGREVTGDPRYYNSVLSEHQEMPPTA